MIKTMLFTGSLKLNVYVKAPAAPRWIELDGVVYPQEVQGLGYGATDPVKVDVTVTPSITAGGTTDSSQS
jgi:hypothetical protein